MGNENYAVRGGKVYRSDGTIAQEGDGLDAQGVRSVKLSSSEIDLRGPHANRPAANLAANKTYWSTDTGEFAISDGVNWRVVAVI